MQSALKYDLIQSSQQLYEENTITVLVLKVRRLNSERLSSVYKDSPRVKDELGCQVRLPPEVTLLFYTFDLDT